MLEVARGVPIERSSRNARKYLENSGLVKKPQSFLNDGWGNQFEVRVCREISA